MEQQEEEQADRGGSQSPGETEERHEVTPGKKRPHLHEENCIPIQVMSDPKQLITGSNGMKNYSKGKMVFKVK